MLRVNTTWNGGSPPRLWGILEKLVDLLCLDRFTPTPVGNTIAQATRTKKTSVHPHACGEYAKRRAAARPDRFTPTPVGNTSCARWVSTRRPVHPHACGEYERSMAKAK